MNTWVISGTHFGHNNVIKYENRPYNSVYEMDEALIKNWNNKVKPNDGIYNIAHNFGYVLYYDKNANILK